jgi:hypothetical protein
LVGPRPAVFRTNRRKTGCQAAPRQSSTSPRGRK